MSDKIPEETLKVWIEEFCKEFSCTEYMRTFDPNLENRWYGYLAAKTSSYEREQKLRTEIDELKTRLTFWLDVGKGDEGYRKLQERAKELEKESEVLLAENLQIRDFVRSSTLRKGKSIAIHLIPYVNAIAIRDELLKEVTPYIKGLMTCTNTYEDDDVWAWIDKVSELEKQEVKSES